MLSDLGYLPRAARLGAASRRAREEARADSLTASSRPRDRAAARRAATAFAAALSGVQNSPPASRTARALECDGEAGGGHRQPQQPVMEGTTMSLVAGARPVPPQTAGTSGSPSLRRGPSRQVQRAARRAARRPEFAGAAQELTASLGRPATFRELADDLAAQETRRQEETTAHEQREAELVREVTDRVLRKLVEHEPLSREELRTGLTTPQRKAFGKVMKTLETKDVIRETGKGYEVTVK